MGIPVLITKTKGFWDPYNFKDNKNIFFATKNSNEEFTKKIIELISDKELLEAVALRGNETVKKHLSIERLNEKIEKFIV